MNLTLRIALWMSRRNGRFLARRLASEGKLPPKDQEERFFQKELEPLGKGLDPALRKALLAEAVASAVQWCRTHGGAG